MTTKEREKLSHAEQNAISWRDMITSSHEAWRFCAAEFHHLSQQARNLSDEARQVLKGHGFDGNNHQEVAEAIEENMQAAPLQVAVRCSQWHDPSSSWDLSPDEFQILLSTGGPALRVTGDLESGRPVDTRLEHQDWGTPWTHQRSTHAFQVDALNWFAGLFWFGEG